MNFYLDRPSCDWVSVSLPITLGPLLFPPLTALLEHCPDVTCLATSPLDRTWGFAARGRLSYLTRGKVGIFSASGGAVSTMRSAGIFEAFLQLLGSEGQYRVTRLDAALDFAKPASRIVHRLYRKALRGTVRLSRKACTASMRSGPCVDGGVTGTVYLGKRTAEVRAYVYDKRQERLDRGYADPGPLVRYEVTVRKQFNPTLRDAWDPEAMFWHFISPDVLTKPSGISDWVGYAEEFKLSNPIDNSESAQYGRYLARMMRSAELKELLTRADEVPWGHHALRKVLRHHGVYDKLIP